MDYEPLLDNLLRDVEKEWVHIIGSPGMPFPLQFSDDEIRQQEQDAKLWAQGVELMNAFADDTGCFKHWDGRVTSVDYEKSKRELDEGVKRSWNVKPGLKTNGGSGSKRYRSWIKVSSKVRRYHWF